MKKTFTVNYIRHVAAFFDRAALDRNLTTTHIGFYMALFEYWNSTHFANPLSVSRSILMGITKIRSTSTYSKILRDLNAGNYLKYTPSKSHTRGSEILMYDFSSETRKGGFRSSEEQINDNRDDENRSSSEHDDDQEGDKDRTSGEHLNERYINNTNTLNTNSVNTTHAREHEVSLVDVGKSDGVPPRLKQVKAFFSREKSSEHEAHKFFLHYESIGWRVGGSGPMKDWHAAAGKWILNAVDFAEKQKDKFNADNKTRDYGEAL